jgi:hypothetical protein
VNCNGSHDRAKGGKKVVKRVSQESKVKHVVEEDSEGSVDTSLSNDSSSKDSTQSLTKVPQAMKNVGVTKKAGATGKTKTWNMMARRVTLEVRRAKKTKKREPPRRDQQSRQR